MRHKEKRRCSSTDFYSVGAERGRPWTEVRRAWSYMRRQGRDCVHQSCAAVPSAYLAVVRRWLCSYSSRALVVPYVDLLAGLWLLLFGLLFVSLFGHLVFEGSLVSGLFRPSRPVAPLGGRRAGSFCPPAVRGPRVFRCGGWALVYGTTWTSAISSWILYLGRCRGIFRVAGCPPGGEICRM